MKSNSEYRAQAREVLKGNWMTSALFVLVYAIFAYALNSAATLPFGQNVALSSGGSIVGTIVMLPMSWGLAVGFLRQLRGEEQQIGWLFDGYTQKRIWTTLILKWIEIGLWALLLIIPGIIKSYSYAMTEFILKDNEDLSENGAIEESMRMMQGHKMDLFLLDLSFIGWAILCILTFGIGFLWLEAYMKTARAAFYEDLKNE